MRVSLGSPRGPMNVRAARLNLMIPVIFFRSSADVGSSLALFYIKVQIGGFYVGCAWMRDVVLDIGTGLRMDLVSLKNIKDGVSQIPPVPPVWLFPLRALSRDGIGPGQLIRSWPDPKKSGLLGQLGRPHTEIRSIGLTSSDPPGKSGRPTYKA
jgi:hypothetical protein